MNKNLIFKLLRYAAILGNIIIILWITYNGIDEGFQGTRMQIVSYVSMVLLLSLNTVLLSLKRGGSEV
jgi:hypothetical protein